MYWFGEMAVPIIIMRLLKEIIRQKILRNYSSREIFYWRKKSPVKIYMAHRPENNQRLF